MKTESNKGENSSSQSIVQNDFPLLSHPSPLPLFLQSDKHHKETIYIFTFIAQYMFCTSLCLHTHTLL